MVRFLQKILNKVVPEKTLEDTILESTGTKSEKVDEGIAFKQDAINYYTGVPAPVYLKDDEWFGPAPEYTEKQKDYMKKETEIKRQEFEKSFSVESEDIHQRMYEIATKSQNSTLHIDPPGGSENFHETGWQSGTGWGQYQ
tara:strand:+ start:239 stop:661 length:423 start_codon:yes stop_codon:yes gene_type:complete